MKPCFCIRDDEFACECFCEDCYDETLPRGYRCICKNCCCEGSGDASGPA